MTHSDALVLKLLKKPKDVWMNLHEILKTHGSDCKVKNLAFRDGAYLTVIATHEKHYWVKDPKGVTFTITPEEATHGWAVHLEDIPLRMCAWVYLESSRSHTIIEFYKEGIIPWGDELNSGGRAVIKNWHRLEDQDIVLSVIK